MIDGQAAVVGAVSARLLDQSDTERLSLNEALQHQQSADSNSALCVIQGRKRKREPKAAVGCSPPSMPVQHADSESWPAASYPLVSLESSLCWWGTVAIALWLMGHVVLSVSFVDTNPTTALFSSSVL